MDSPGSDYLVDFAVLEDGLRQQVQHLLDRQGTFLPCAGTIDKDGQFAISAVYGGDERPDPSQSVRNHLEAFRKRAATGTRAWAVAADVTIKSPRQEPHDGVQVWLEHSGGQTSEIVIPYEHTETGYHLGETRRTTGGPNLAKPRHGQRLEPAAPLLPVVDLLVLNDPGPLESAAVRACVAVVDPTSLPRFEAAMAQAVHPLRPLRVALTTSWEAGGMPPRLTLNLHLRPLRKPWQRLAARIVFDVDGCRDWLALALEHRIAVVTRRAGATESATSLIRRAVDVTPPEQDKVLLSKAISVAPQGPPDPT